MKMCIKSNTLSVYTYRRACAFARKVLDVLISSINNAEIDGVEVYKNSIRLKSSGSNFCLLSTIPHRLQKLNHGVLIAHQAFLNVAEQCNGSGVRRL